MKIRVRLHKDFDPIVLSSYTDIQWVHKKQRKRVSRISEFISECDERMLPVQIGGFILNVNKCQ